MNNVRVTFLGGAGTVTGSKFLVQYDGKQLLVDCGLFQGYKQLRLRNRTPLPVEPNHIDAVILTHAHLDHSGYFPLLVKEGFKGKAWCTSGTRDLCQILLPDSGHIQEEDAAFANRHGSSKHSPALPLYTEEDAVRSLKLLHTAPPLIEFEPIKGWKARFYGAGHILGASCVGIEVGGKRLLFSGDLGRPDDLIMLPPDPPPAANAVFVESTYGDREHGQEAAMDELEQLLNKVAARGGTAVLPVFAVGRAQAVLHAIAELKRLGRIPSSLPVFLDSPMAIHSTEAFMKHVGEHRLSLEQCRAMGAVAKMVMSPDESKAIALQHGPKVILAASGMATGGRVLHHLIQYLGSHKNMVILTGFQAAGTRGATLAKGGTQLRIFGQDFEVKAEVCQLQSASAHADASQLMQWLRAIPGTPKRVFTVHGELDAADALRRRIESELGWHAMVPEHGSTWAV